MTCHISVRDVIFNNTTDGVQVVVETDVTSHLFLRQSTKHPWIHKKPVKRRGMWLNDDVRFCFTVYEDNEQDEPGDTLIHTFTKEPWPVCETRYAYFWGSISGDICVSTSPLFSYHKPVLTMEGPYYLTITAKLWTRFLDRAISGETYIQCHDNPDAEHVLLSGARPCNQAKTAPNYFWIRRVPLYFDLSGLPANIFVASAIMHQYGQYPVAGIDDMHLFLAPGLHDPPVVSDYGYILGLTTNPVYILDKTGLQFPRNRHWLFNKAAIDAIVAGGILKLAMRCEQDVIAQPPVDATGQGWVFMNDPTYLIITYWTIN